MESILGLHLLIIFKKKKKKNLNTEDLIHIENFLIVINIQCDVCTSKKIPKKKPRNLFSTISGNIYKLYFHKYIQYYLCFNRVRNDPGTK